MTSRTSGTTGKTRTDLSYRKIPPKIGVFSVKKVAVFSFWSVRVVTYTTQ